MTNEQMALLAAALSTGGHLDTDGVVERAEAFRQWLDANDSTKINLTPKKGN